MTTDRKVGANRGNAGKGRPKGVPNKATREFRQTVQKLLEDNSENVGVWLTQVAQGHGENKASPEKALDLLAKLAEFAAPKLSRAEVANSDDKPFKLEFGWKSGE